MDAGGRLQTVYGFCCELDWWPTVFEDAFPQSAVCSACGLVCSMSATITCGHILCRRCYSKCADGESYRCPLDAQASRKEDVAWSTVSLERLLCCKIRCWNARNGCTLVGPAYEILAHFKDDCQYHAASCQRCRRTVVQKDVIGHLASSNCSQEPQAPPSLEGVGANSLFQSLQSLNQKLTESTRLSLNAIKDIHAKQASLERNMVTARQFSRQEIDGLVVQLESRMRNMCGANTAKVLTSCSCIESVATALRAVSANSKRYTIKACTGIHESINKKSATGEILEFIKKLDERFSVIMDASKVIFEKNLSSSEALEWTIGSWSKLKDAKVRGEIAISWAENPGLFYGYSILPGAEIANSEGTMSLCLVFQLCKGPFDQLLPWPLQKDFHFKVLHPSDSDSLECQNLSTKNMDPEGLRRPRTDRSTVQYARNGIAITTLEENGYSLNDQIRVSFEVFP
ncbi:TNF receptor-associated factor 3-like [Haemaphysalis longicornis]